MPGSRQARIGPYRSHEIFLALPSAHRSHGSSRVFQEDGRGDLGTELLLVAVPRPLTYLRIPVATTNYTSGPWGLEPFDFDLGPSPAASPILFLDFGLEYSRCLTHVKRKTAVEYGTNCAQACRGGAQTRRGT